MDGTALVDVRDNGGKMRKGTGVWVNKETTICTFRMHGSDGDGLVCKAAVKGKFLTSNKALCQDSSILLKRPHDEGFLCTLCLFPDDRDKALKQLLTREQYCELRDVPIEKLR